MDELDGKVALVTGGSRGMGARMATAFAERGADVVIASRKFDSCAELANLLGERFGVRTLPVAFNASDWTQCDSLVDRVYAEFNRVDVLVNNAGLSPLYPSLDLVSEALFDKVIGVNLKGPFRLAAAIGTRMQQSGGGSIINIGSIEALYPDASALPYAAAKSALHTLTEGFARAFAPQVRVNTIHAGPFLTDISDNWTAGTREELEARVALGRCGEPSEIVGAVLFLATAASSYVTGGALRVDGGYR